MPLSSLPLARRLPHEKLRKDMGILEGKKLLVTGVLMESSIAFHVAKLAQEEGAEIVLTSFGRTTKITQAIAKRLPVERPRSSSSTSPTPSTSTPSPTGSASTSTGLDGVLHSIGFAPQGAFNFMEGTWEDVATAVHISAYSLKSLAVAALPLMSEGEQRRGAHLRREVRLARVRLDGRRQGGVRVDQPLPRP